MLQGVAMCFTTQSTLETDSREVPISQLLTHGALSSHPFAGRKADYCLWSRIGYDHPRTFRLEPDRRPAGHRADEVVSEIGGLVGGPQTFLGPVLAIPYEVAPTPNQKAAERGVYVVFPTRADAVAQTRDRSTPPVAVQGPGLSVGYRLQGMVRPSPASPHSAPDGAVLDWNRAEFLVGATDARGAQADRLPSAQAEKLQTLAPAAALRSVTVKLQQGGETQLTLFGEEFRAWPSAYMRNST